MFHKVLSVHRVILDTTVYTLICNMSARQVLILLFSLQLTYSSHQLEDFNEMDTHSKLNNLYSTNCTKDTDCVLNAYCYYKRCTCKDGYLPDKDTGKGPVKCIKKATNIEDYCEKDVQCQAAFGTLSTCKKPDPSNNIGKCNCTDNAHFFYNICYENAYIGEICEVNNNCFIRSRDIEAYCEYGHCICPPQHHPIDGGKDCVPTSELYGPCLSTSSCITDNSECTHYGTYSFCNCKQDFVNSYDNTSCIEVAKYLGRGCKESIQCTLNIRNSWCSDEGACACKDGHHETDGGCWVTKKLLDPCENTNECRIDAHHGLGIHCLERICQCMNNYEMQENKFCIKYANFTETIKSGVDLNNVSTGIFVGLVIFNFIYLAKQNYFLF